MWRRGSIPELAIVSVQFALFDPRRSTNSRQQIHFLPYIRRPGCVRLTRGVRSGEILQRAVEHCRGLRIEVGGLLVGCAWKRTGRRSRILAVLGHCRIA
jgi:hypothetical protein